MAKTIKVTDTTYRLLQQYAAEHYDEKGAQFTADESADDLVAYASARLNALAAYHAKKAAKGGEKKPRAKKTRAS